MHYGKKSVSNTQKKISSKGKKTTKRVGVRLFKAFVVCMILLMIAGAAGAGLFVKKIIDDAPTVTPDDVKPSGFTTFVYAADGTEIERFVASGSNRIYKTIDQIPDYLGNAFVAVEDSRFYEHNGIDIQGIMRAAVVGVTSGNFSEGASTLTQQLIKNNVFPNFLNEETFFDSLQRKLQEQYLAVEIEKQMSKDEILEAYMNTINLGQNCLGVQSAALRYFNKDVSELTLSEATVIAGITQNPAKYNPIVNPEKNAERRVKVLGDMLEQGYITQEEHDAALADDVYSRIQTTNAAVAEETPYTYFVDALVEQVLEDLQEKKGYTYNQAYNALYSGGLTIKTTQDLNIQKICDEEVADNSNYPGLIEYGLSYVGTIWRADGTVENYSTEMLKKYLSDTKGGKYPLVFSSPEAAQQAVDDFKATLNIQEGDTVDERVSISPQPQTSVVIMDQYTGQVKAIVGGRGSKETSLSLNRATDSPRQPGSCFKILSTYVPALDAGGYSLGTGVEDAPFTYDNGRPVRNWWGANSYRGWMSVRTAIEQSANVVTVKVLDDITPQLGYDYLMKMRFTTLVDGTDENFPGFTDINLPTALGGLTKGVYNIEMTAAYAAIANDGIYTEPILYTEILDHDGNVLLANTPETERIMENTTASLITNAMVGVVTRGTGTRARLSGMPVSGKTGTTSDNVDIWFSAYTPYYTCSVWGGYDTNKPMNNTSWHLTLWRNIMQRVHADLEYKDFEMTGDIVRGTVCKETGLLCHETCDSITEYFAKGALPTKRCEGHATEFCECEEHAPEDCHCKAINGPCICEMTETCECAPHAPEDCECKAKNGPCICETPEEGGEDTPPTTEPTPTPTPTPDPTPTPTPTPDPTPTPTPDPTPTPTPTPEPAPATTTDPVAIINLIRRFWNI